MARVRFTDHVNVTNADGVIVESYVPGQVVKLSEASAARWVRRGLAETVGADVPVGKPEAPAAEAAGDLRPAARRGRRAPAAEAAGGEDE